MTAAKKSKSKVTIDQSRPFMGLRSFEEKNKSQFGGRNKEIARLYRLVEDHNLTVVYGTSGIGKTSILKAGLMPELRQNFYFPIYIRIDFSSSKLPFDQLKDHLFRHLNQLDPRVKKMETQTIWEYLHEVNLLDGLVTPVLIFDQFEEIFTLGKKKKGIKEFVTELANLSQNRIPASVKLSYAKQGKTVPSRYNKLNFRIIISLREDYLPRLDELKNYIPSILDNGFRVVQMSISQAMEAAIKPGKGLIDRRTAEAIIKKLPGISQADFDVLNEKGKQKKKLKVEPFLLSLICQRLNELRIKNELNTITIDLIKKFKVDDSISSFYDETISDYRPEVDIAIQELLLDIDGYRKLDPLKEFQDEYGITDEEVNKLIDARIIRKESRNNVEYLEIIHDVLAPGIKKKRSARKRLVKTRKLKQIIFIVIASAFIIGGIIAIIVWQDFEQKRNNTWEFVEKINTISGYEKFQEIFPNSHFNEQALLKRDSIKWNAALESNTSEGFQFYLTQLKSDSIKASIYLSNEYTEYFKIIRSHSQIASVSIKKIDSINEVETLLEQKAWDKAKEGDNFDSYLEYISGNFDTNYSTAIQKLKEYGKIGWLYAGNTKGKKMHYSRRYPKIIQFEWRKNKKTIDNLEIPKQGDIISASPISRNTYFLLQNLNESERKNNPAWIKNTKAYVLDDIIDGGFLILKIVYKK